MCSRASADYVLVGWHPPGLVAVGLAFWTGVSGTELVVCSGPAQVDVGRVGGSWSGEAVRDGEAPSSGAAIIGGTKCSPVAAQVVASSARFSGDCTCCVAVCGSSSVRSVLVMVWVRG